MKKGLLLGMATFIAAQASQENYGKFRGSEEGYRKRDKVKDLTRQNLSKGLKLFLYKVEKGEKVEHVEIWAINKKNADRKAKKQGLI